MLISRNFDNTIRWREGERLEQLFEARVDALAARGLADHAAVETEAETLSFRELDARANRVARYLRSHGIGSGDRIGLLFDKSAETYVAMLAVLKVNAAYVPLDGGFPAGRLAFIAGDAGIKAVVTMSDLAPKLAHLGVPLISLDAARDEIGRLAGSRLLAAEKPAATDELSYVIYTSGTTGNPKGVAIDHASICNFVRVASDVYRYQEDDRVYQGMTIAFDFSVEELWVPLIAGATLIPGKPGTSLVGSDLADYLKERRITALCCVPTLLATVERDLPGLRFLLVSGEACPQSLVQRWHKPGRLMLNAYGPTEATVTATVTEPRPDKPVTIGVPLPTYTIHILDEHETRPVPRGAMGEIAIAGIGLARGYLNRPDLTAEKFVPDTLGTPNNPSGRIYRTGDLGRITEDGEVEFHGRIDTQVKIRGYRIELGEIEAVLLQFPGIGQAAVHTFEPEPGAVELVAYYALKQGVAEIADFEIAQAMRRQLPPYMVPAYYERLPVIPMTASHKADRKALPPPKAARVAASSGDRPFIVPRTPAETAIAAVLAEVMKLDRVSAIDHFFHDLGAHSLLMARFCSELRKRPGLACASMRDVYLHPTVAALAAHLATGQRAGLSRPRRLPLLVPSRLAYIGCGAAQLATYLVLAVLVSLILETGYTWAIAPDHGWLETYVRVSAFAASAFVLLSLLPVVAKWLLVGRWREEAIPVWSLAYYRFWLVRLLMRGAPAAWMTGTPIYNIYLRLLGARIGENAVIMTRFLPVSTDLLSVGANAILRKDSIVLGYKAEANYIYTGPVTIGDDAVVGESSLLDIATTIGDHGQLGHASSLQTGQTVPARGRAHGSPAQATETDFRQVEDMPGSRLRRALFTAAQLGWICLGAVPLVVMGGKLFFDLLLGYIGSNPFPAEVSARTLALLGAKAGLAALVLLAAVLAGGLAVATLASRLLARVVEPGRIYPMFGAHYAAFRFLSALSNISFFNLLLGDSSFIVGYLHALGIRLGRVVQTGANFGLDQRFDSPHHCEVGSGSMVSDGLSMINAVMSATAFAVQPARIGESNYLGNNVVVPAGARTGANCLLATKVMVPTDGGVRENVGLLGSPAFEIPRTVERDQSLKIVPGDAGFPGLLAKKDRRNAATIVMLLAVLHLYSTVLLLAAVLVGHSGLDFASLTVTLIATALLSISYFVLIERASLGFGSLESRVVSMYDDGFLFHERHWKFCGSAAGLLFKGTPMKNVISRLLGVKVGRMVFDDGCLYFDKTLITVGDFATLNEFAMLQGHSLEEGVFKSDRVVVGRGCTIGTGAFLHYGVTLGPDVVVDPDSFMMKGETAAAATTWQGNPAMVVAGPAPAASPSMVAVALPPPAAVASPSLSP